MSDDLPENVAPVLRREALLPNERARGLGTVAIVCTMAGVASGLALATTLMAMQVADSMSTRACPYQHAELSTVEVRPEQGFLGVLPVFHDGVTEIEQVLPGTPAEAISLRPGDHLISINGDPMDWDGEVQHVIRHMHPGATPQLVIERGAVRLTLHPTLVAWPPITY